MTDYSGNLPPAGWYPDPYGAPYERWWDGAQWTDHTNVPAAPEPVAAPPADPEPAAPSYNVTSEPAYQAPLQTSEQAYQAPQQTSEQTYQAPLQTNEQAYQAALQTNEQAYKSPAAEPNAWETPAATGSSFDDIFATGQTPAAEVPATQTAQPAYTQQAPASFAEQDPQAFPFSGSTSPEFNELITGGASGSSDPYDSWSNEDYEEPPRNTLATVGVTFGVLSFIIPAVAGLVGLVTSALGLVRSAGFKRDEGVAIGRGKSIAGIVLSVVGTAASVAFVLLVLPSILNPSDTSATDASSELVANAQKTEWGNIAMEQGATGTINFAGTTDPSIQFTVTGITPDPACTEDPALVLSPENGQFVALTMEFTTAAEYSSAMTSGGLLQISSADFVGLLADGSAVVNTTAGTSCVPEAEQLPAEIPAGSTVTGTVILDLSPETASFSFAPAGVTGLDPATRWEWAIPR